jgi:deoxyribonuclease V
VSSRWPTTVAEARALQERLRDRVIVTSAHRPVRMVAGVDVHVAAATGLAWAAIALVELDRLELIESVLAATPTTFPYVPGYLSFRELPAALAALALLHRSPDLLMVDGQGIAHPRRLGLASHLGVVTDLPSIGVAKSRLIGAHPPLGQAQGSRAALHDRGERIGTVLRTAAGVRPLYISIGHRIGLRRAERLVLAALAGYRLPEPTRLADRLSRMHP